MTTTINRIRSARGMYLHLQTHPSNNRVSISYSLLNDTSVELSIYNQHGYKVSTLLQDHQKSGKHNMDWDCSSLKSGMYFLHLKGSGRQLVKRMSVINIQYD